MRYFDRFSKIPAHDEDFDMVIAETQFQLLITQSVGKISKKVKDCEKEEKHVFFRYSLFCTTHLGA